MIITIITFRNVSRQFPIIIYIINTIHAEQATHTYVLLLLTILFFFFLLITSTLRLCRNMTVRAYPLFKFKSDSNLFHIIGPKDYVCCPTHHRHHDDHYKRHDDDDHKDHHHHHHKKY